MIKIGDKEIGDIPYVCAEFGVNHNGSLERAKDAIVKAAKAGADAIKFQTYTADELVVKGTPKFWDAEVDKDKKDQHEAYKSLEGFKKEWYPELIRCCEENNIEFLSTPFSAESADYLNSLGMKAFKVASSDMSTIPYLKHIARYGKPIILSTGASTMEEIHEALTAIEGEGNYQTIILHCTLSYPTPPNGANLNLIRTLQQEFPMNPVGISDHTLGVFPAVVAVAMGAVFIEKHYTVDKSLPHSADHWLSVDPEELEEIVCMARDVYILGGSKEKKIFACEAETRQYDKRSLVSKKDIPCGAVITEDMLTYKRPGTGIEPKYFWSVVGKVAHKDIKADTTLQWNYLQQ